MTPLLADRVAFVSGGARGIGLAVVERFAQEGASVMIGDVRPDAAEETVASLRAQGATVEAVELDVTSPDSVQAAEAACRARLGVADIVVANAGILVLAPALELPLDAWQRVLDVNLTGVFLTAREFARAMVDADRPGRIIVTSSLYGRRGGRENAAYSASKFGVIGLVECLAAELAPHGVLVNAVCPGQVDTEMMRQLFDERSRLRELTPEDVAAEMVARIPMGRLAEPREIADMFVYLASPLASYITGQSLVADGGMQVG